MGGRDYGYVVARDATFGVIGRAPVARDGGAFRASVPVGRACRLGSAAWYAAGVLVYVWHGSDLPPGAVLKPGDPLDLGVTPRDADALAAALAGLTAASAARRAATAAGPGGSWRDRPPLL